MKYKFFTRNNKNKQQLILLAIGILLIALSALMFVNKSNYWHFVAPFGVLFLFDYISHKVGNKTPLGLIFERNYKVFFKLYLLSIVLGMVIELVLSITLHLWSYKLCNYSSNLFYIILMMINNPSMFFISILGWVTYAAILLSFVEQYEIFLRFFNKTIALVMSMTVGIIIWEIPNLYSKDWIYSIPYIKFELFGINIVVITIIWAILILAPYYVYQYVLGNKFKNRGLRKLINKS